MLLDFPSLVKKYELNVTGVIQVGSHYAEEYEMLKNLGVKYFVLVEPCKKAFEVIKEKLAHIHEDKTNETIVCSFNRALADYDGTAFMWTETINQGQSNSLLIPMLHLQQHPDIIFEGREEVKVSKLDDLDLGTEFSSNQLNTLLMDVQGAELLVLKGAVETLNQIDYIYTEVNRAEVYEKCARIEQLDEYLNQFKRVETKWVGNWGDSLYIRKIHNL